MPRGLPLPMIGPLPLEEIIQMLKYPDVRIKAIVLTIISSGIRVGAWDYLRWKYVVPVEVKRVMPLWPPK